MKPEERDSLYTSITREILGKKIREIRGKETREEFVRRLESKTSASKLESYENGRAFPPLNFLIQLSLICNKSIDHLLLKREESPLLFKEDLDDDQREVLGLLERYPKLIEVMKEFKKAVDNDETKELVEKVFGEFDEEKLVNLALVLS